ncbi:hypothetical protein [Microbacterium awajiense]
MRREAGRWVEVTVSSAVIAVHREDPVATVDAIGRDRQVVSWPDLPVGRRSVTSTVLAGPSGAWVVYQPMESEDPSFPKGDAAAVHVCVDGSVTRFTMLEDTQPVGATGHGLWLTSGGFPDPNDPTEWHQRQRLSVLATDGTAHIVQADRKAAFAFEEQASAHLVVYDGPPDVNRDGRGATYAYRYAAWPLPAHLPARLRAADMHAEPLDEGALREALAAKAPVTAEESPSRPELRWDVIPLAPADQAAAIDSVKREFDSLENYWRAPDGRTSPLSDGLADSHVESIDEWPRTRVEVSFTHPSYREGRLRRTLRVFDDAGRARPALYAAIHLMEDLDTRALPEPEKARDGVLDI